MPTEKPKPFSRGPERSAASFRKPRLKTELPPANIPAEPPPKSANETAATEPASRSTEFRCPVCDCTMPTAAALEHLQEHVTVRKDGDVAVFGVGNTARRVPDPEKPAQAVVPRDPDAMPVRWGEGMEAWVPLPPGEGKASEFIGERLTLDWVNGVYVLPRMLGTSTLAEAPSEALIHRGRVDMHALSNAVSWTHFVEGKVVERIPFKPGQPFPKRDELQPPAPPPPALDPWKLTGYLYLHEPESGQDYTFYGSGKYAKGAIDDLQALVVAKQAKDPGAVPLVRLDAREVAGKGGKRAGWAPVFTLRGWQLPNGDDLPV